MLIASEKKVVTTTLNGEDKEPAFVGGQGAMAVVRQAWSRDSERKDSAWQRLRKRLLSITRGLTVHTVKMAYYGLDRSASHATSSSKVSQGKRRSLIVQRWD